jgi:hypothetical protein
VHVIEGGFCQTIRRGSVAVPVPVQAVVATPSSVDGQPALDATVKCRLTDADHSGRHLTVASILGSWGIAKPFVHTVLWLRS